MTNYMKNLDILLHVAWLMRWGSPQEHGYVVSIHKDMEKCDAVAKHEAEQRGGKYLPTRVPCHLDMGQGEKYSWRELENVKYPEFVFFVAVQKYIPEILMEIVHPVGVFSTEGKAREKANSLYPEWKVEVRKIRVKD